LHVPTFLLVALLTLAPSGHLLLQCHATAPTVIDGAASAVHPQSVRAGPVVGGESSSNPPSSSAAAHAEVDEHDQNDNFATHGQCEPTYQPSAIPSSLSSSMKTTTKSKSTKTTAAAAAALQKRDSKGIRGGDDLRGLHPLLARFPEPARFFASGLIGNTAFYALDRVLYKILLEAVSKKRSPVSAVDTATSHPPAASSPGTAPSAPSPVQPISTSLNGAASAAPSAAALASVSFATAYLLQILLQHVLNAFLVYGPSTIATRSLYLKSLLSTYTTYAGGLVISTFLNGWLTSRGMNKDTAFFVTLGGVGVGNYAALGWFNRRAAATAAAAEEESKKKT